MVDDDLVDPVNAANAGVTVPVVAAAFTPTVHPLLVFSASGFGAHLFRAALNTGLISSLKSAFQLISFLSSHRRFSLWLKIEAWSFSRAE